METHRFQTRNQPNKVSESINNADETTHSVDENGYGTCRFMALLQPSQDGLTTPNMIHVCLPPIINDRRR